MKKKNSKKIRKKKSARKGRSVLLGRIAKITGALLVVLLIAYFSVGFFLDKGFLKRDLGEKYGKVLGATTTTLTLRVIGPPNKPVISATPVCVNYIPYVNLSWTSDDQMDYFDLEKDGAPLVSGLTDPTYQDALVQPSTNYTYIVTAFNSLGQKSSDPVVATALDCGTPSPPPVLTATPVCVDNVPFVNLSWTVDDQMQYFDLEKNGNPLASGLTESQYEDGAVEPLASYSYAVTAFTSGGPIVSNVASATALDCTVAPPPPPPPPSQEPSCTITKFQNINLSTFHGIPSSKEKRPKFFGTTNIQNAEIDIVISGKTSVIAKTSANENGFWMWRPPDNLNFGLHKIEATAIDPHDPARKKTASLNFRIVHPEGSEEKEEAIPPSAENAGPPEQQPAPPVEPGQEAPVGMNLSVEVKNPDSVAFQGRDLNIETKIEIGEDQAAFDSDLRYSIVDENYEEIFQTSDRIHVGGNVTIEKKLTIPRLLKPGKYKVVVSLARNGTVVVAEDSFLLKEVPLVSLGAGVTITATQVMSNLFWVILWLLILLLIFLALLGVEYWISGRAIIGITEETLREKGLITRKKTR